jgi:hypothetical protein
MMTALTDRERAAFGSSNAHAEFTVGARLGAKAIGEFRYDPKAD